VWPHDASGAGDGTRRRRDGGEATGGWPRGSAESPRRAKRSIPLGSFRPEWRWALSGWVGLGLGRADQFGLWRRLTRNPRAGLALMMLSTVPSQSPTRHQILRGSRLPLSAGEARDQVRRTGRRVFPIPYCSISHSAYVLCRFLGTS
jgi:hypothetical protein